MTTPKPTLDRETPMEALIREVHARCCHCMPIRDDDDNLMFTSRDDRCERFAAELLEAWRRRTSPEMAARDTESVARLFHDTYERLAPRHGWTTNAATACEWEKLPHANRELMMDVVRVVLGAIDARHKGGPT